jgi:GNAT superfamily N-acetyltransferase
VISYRDGSDGVEAADLDAFFVGWPSPPSTQRRVEILRGSDVVVLALDDDRLVGFATAVTDGALSAFVPLLEVLPEYQERGIGTELARRILARLDDLYMVDLTCDEELVPFYERLGLRRVGIAMGVRKRALLRDRRPSRPVAFDDVVIIDWSAASKPKLGRDSIWIGTASSTEREPVNVATRGQALRVLTDHLVDLVGNGHRVLVGFDFPYGYPRGTAARLGLAGEEPPWLRMWDELARLVTDGATNANNRFEAAAELNSRGACFWARPASSSADVPFRKPPLTLPEFRATDLRLRAQRKYVHSAWQLAGAGSVGSQALLGIPIVRALRFDERLADVSCVWPFETGFALPDDAQVVHAEIWPGIVRPLATVHEIADARQVLSLARHFRDLRPNELGRLFTAGQDDNEAEVEEGWILGAV